MSICLRRREFMAASHRLSSLVDCSTILVFDRGQMVGNGPHRRLLEDCETYRTLWEKQSRSFR